MINGSRVEIVLWQMVSLKNTSCQQHTSDLRHWCRYTYTHRREPAMYYTHRLWLFTRSFSHHLMINMPLSNACSSATQCLQSQLVLVFFVFVFSFLSDISFFPRFIIVLFQPPIPYDTKWKNNEPSALFLPLTFKLHGSRSFAFSLLLFEERKGINFKESNTGSQILYLCSSDWMSLEPSWADLEKLLYLCLLYFTLSPALYSLNGLFISKPRK